MAVQRPKWVVEGLASVLGLDQESVTQMILPDLESYQNEARLTSHLQDFLGSSVEAREFTSKYTSLRFPRLSVPAPLAPPSPGLKAHGSRGDMSAGRSKPSSSTGTPTNRQSGSTQSITDALETAFGPGGKIYQKNRNADIGSQLSRPNFGLPGGNGAASGSGSGAATPSGSRAPVRHAGAVTISEARSRGGASERGSQKGKSREEKIWDHPKSAKVKKLEKLQEDLKVMQVSEGKVQRMTEGKECFCQARLHPLSSYTPQCGSCGLILCHLQPPHTACPSCLRPLLTPSSLARLLLRIQADIDEQLAQEQSARDEVKRAEQRALEAQAAFPYLSGASSGGASTPYFTSNSTGGGSNQARKVLSIGSGRGKGGRGKITVTTHTPSPITSPPIVAEEEKYSEDVIGRPRSPPLEKARIEKELSKNLKWREEEDRPWGDMKNSKQGDTTGWAYAESPILILSSEDRVGRRKGKKGRGGGEGVDGRVVPGAAAVAA